MHNLGDVIECPKDLSETGFLLIVGDQTSCDPQQLNPAYRWDFQVVSWDIYKQERIGEMFPITIEEMKTWKKK